MTMVLPRIVIAPRCERCNKKLAEYTAVPYKFTCTRRGCGHINEVLH